MKLQKRMTISLALAALALGLTTTQASAQPVLKGTFEMPTAAYLGNTLLQPGQYTIWMNTEETGGLVHAIHVAGEGVSKTFLAISKPTVESARCYLQIANIDGTYVVDKLATGMLGQSFGFGVTKSVRNKALRASAGPAITVPVTSEAGF